MSRYQIRIAILIMLLVGTTNYADASPAGVAGALGAAAAKHASKGAAEHCSAGRTERGSLVVVCRQ